MTTLSLNAIFCDCFSRDSTPHMATELLPQVSIPPTLLRQKRYAIAGTGIRGMSSAQAILSDFCHVATLAALYDPNRSRIQAFARLLNTELPCYQDFGALIAEARPDTLIISTHRDGIPAWLGCDRRETAHHHA